MRDIAAEKAALRKIVRAQKRAMKPEDNIEIDKRIEKNILSLEEYAFAQTVFCFVSYGAEPETRGILERAFADNKKVTVPKCRENGQMSACVISSFDDLSAGAYGILEPSDNVPQMDFSQIDFAVIPALACGENGERLGQGGGYYDRFLEKFCGTCAAVCHEKFMMDNIPEEKHDARLPLIVTEDRILRIGGTR